MTQAFNLSQFANKVNTSGQADLTTAVTGTLAVANGGTGVTTSTGSGNNVLSTSPTLVTPILGTPTSGTLTNCTGYPSSALSGTLSVSGGGTGATTLTGLVLGNGTSAFTTVTAPSGAVVGTTDTQTLTNKRVTPRVSTTTSSATPTINTDNVDLYGLTAQAVDITSFTTNLSGTPTDGQRLHIYIVGTAARAITWGASFEASTVSLPTTTVTTNRLDVGFVWNSATSKWRCVAVA